MDQFIPRKPISTNNHTLNCRIWLMTSACTPPYTENAICIFSVFHLIYSTSTTVGLLDLCLPFGVCLFTILVKGENYCNVIPACVCCFCIPKRGCKIPMNIISAGVGKELWMKFEMKESWKINRKCDCDSNRFYLPLKCYSRMKKKLYANVNKQLQLPFSCLLPVKKVVIIVLHVFTFQAHL